MTATEMGVDEVCYCFAVVEADFEVVQSRRKCITNMSGRALSKTRSVLVDRQRLSITSYAL